MAEELNKAYKAHRVIEKGFDKLISTEFLQMNVFKKNYVPEKFQIKKK